LASSAQLPKKVFYVNIFQLNYRPSSQCEFFESYDVGGSYIAYCKVLESYIARSKVRKCEISYQDCPYRRAGLKALTPG
jgi:hypothetical protein